MSSELGRLRDAVNAARYRNIRKDGQIEDFYRHPFSYDVLEAIAEAALALILAEEAALAASLQQNPEVQSPS